jgi:hypothetical protein
MRFKALGSLFFRRLKSRQLWKWPIISRRPLGQVFLQGKKFDAFSHPPLCGYHSLEQIPSQKVLGFLQAMGLRLQLNESTHSP